MLKASSKGIASRFKTGSAAVKDGLLKQTLVANDSKLASAIVASGTVVNFRKSQIITQQQNPDNDIYFVLCGSVQIIVNGHAVATRSANTHFGEMAAMDYTARRSATVIALEETVAFQLPQQEFAKIAGRFSSVWQRLAVELAGRIRERAKLLPNKNAKPILFIGSSSEGMQIATAIKEICAARCSVDIRLWSDGVFRASKTTIENLIAAAESSDFSVLVLTPDDRTKSRTKVKPAPRDNVIFELGLFTGALGRDRSLIVMPSLADLKVPTDLLGVTTLRYAGAVGKAALKKQLQKACNEIVARIKELGPK